MARAGASRCFRGLATMRSCKCAGGHRSCACTPGYAAMVQRWRVSCSLISLHGNSPTLARAGATPYLRASDFGLMVKSQPVACAARMLETRPFVDKKVWGQRERLDVHRSGTRSCPIVSGACCQVWHVLVPAATQPACHTLTRSQKSHAVMPQRHRVIIRSDTTNLARLPSSRGILSGSGPVACDRTLLLGRALNAAGPAQNGLVAADDCIPMFMCDQCDYSSACEGVIEPLRHSANAQRESVTTRNDRGLHAMGARR
jgi:hypothetical protein